MGGDELIVNLRAIERLLTVVTTMRRQDKDQDQTQKEDNTTQYSARQDTTRHDKTTQGKARQYNAEQDKTRQDGGMMMTSYGLFRAGQDKTRQDIKVKAAFIPFVSVESSVYQLL
jgi:hypothetical protein